MTKKIVKIKNDTYGQPFWWVQAETDSEFTEILKKEIPNLAEQIEINDDGMTAGECVTLIVNNQAVICFWFRKNDLSVMAHELLHAVLFCARIHGLVLSKESDEAFCYLFDWLIGVVLKKVIKHNGKISK
jgi:hypothetical protein